MGRELNMEAAVDVEMEGRRGRRRRQMSGKVLACLQQDILKLKI